jgi:NTP pyrophosphatase (non-canonical NTP hydrolase)
MNDYQKKARKFFVVEGDDNTLLHYLALGLCEEAGEVAGKVKRIMRDDNGVLTDERLSQIILELGDTLWYLSTLADVLEVPLETVAWNNIRKLTERQQKGTIHGSGDNR